MGIVPFVLFAVFILIPCGIADADEIDFVLDPATPPKGPGVKRFSEQTFTLGSFDCSPAGMIEGAEISGTWSGRLFWRPHIYLYLGDVKIADIHFTQKRGIEGAREFVRQWRGWRTSHVWSYTFSAEEIALLNEYSQDGAVDFRIVGKPHGWSKFMKFSLGETDLSVVNSSGEMDSSGVEPSDLEVDPTEVEPEDSDNLVTTSLGFDQGINSNSAPVPEPVSFFLLGSGLLGLAGFRKKLKKKINIQFLKIAVRSEIILPFMHICASNC